MVVFGYLDMGCWENASGLTYAVIKITLKGIGSCGGVLSIT